MNLRGKGSRLDGTNHAATIIWPRRKSTNPNVAMDHLFELFPDKYPVLLTESEDAWTFGLSWPQHILEHIDPALAERANTCYGLELKQLANYLEIRRYGRVDFVFSMFHSRALLAPAFAARRQGGKPLRCIIHVDAHHDLLAPLLVAEAPNKLVNALLGIECRLDDPESVVRTIDCGLIHKGSFLTAFCLGVPQGHLFHVCKDISPDQFWLHRVTNSVQIGGASTLQNSFDIRPDSSPIEWKLSESSRLPQILPVEVTDGIWLDIDLDAFCNRFDGDSNQHKVRTSVEETTRMKLSIAEFLGDLSVTPWLPQVRAVSVAASPGFFPSDYWEYAIPTVCEGIAKAFSI